MVGGLDVEVAYEADPGEYGLDPILILDQHKCINFIEDNRLPFSITLKFQ